MKQTSGLVSRTEQTHPLSVTRRPHQVQDYKGTPSPSPMIIQVKKSSLQWNNSPSHQGSEIGSQGTRNRKYYTHGT